MEWISGLALLPALACGAMMGGMALAGLFGWRRSQQPSPTEGEQAATPTELTGSPR